MTKYYHLDDTINKILTDIETQINNELIRINKEIHSDKKKKPRLSLKRKTYKYDHSSNTGTGKSYADLIAFDLAIIKLTDLAMIIHDSILFKNVGACGQFLVSKAHLRQTRNRYAQ